MARGWESKAVESQQQDAESRKQTTITKSSAQQTRERLLLDRTRILEEIQRACDKRLRGQLEAALAFLDKQLTDLDTTRT